MTEESKMPDEIYAIDGQSRWGYVAPFYKNTKYIKSDIIDAREKKLVERIEKLESTLKFYADKDNNGTCAGCIRALGYGERAREALKEDK